MGRKSILGVRLGRKPIVRSKVGTKSILGVRLGRKPVRNHENKTQFMINPDITRAFTLRLLYSHHFLHGRD